MTVLLAGVSFLLAATLSLFLVGVGRVASERARAQTAADAAALAAVAESAVTGSGDPRATAQEFARVNGARLTHCLCRPGATAAQVTVSFGAATARARAVFDPTRVVPLPGPGLHPVLADAVARLIAASGGSLTVVSGHRTAVEQQLLWQEALHRYGSPEAADDWVARPGSSMHERGLAVDLGGDLELAGRLVAELGLPLSRPLPNEPWHFEFDPE